MSKPFCDRLTVSVPRSHDAALRDVQREFGASLGGRPDPRRAGLCLVPGGGALFYQARSRFAVLEASGVVLASLRSLGIYADYLGALGVLPHRVTRLDATLDLSIRAAPVVHDLYARAKAGCIALGRKMLPAGDARAILSKPLYPDEDLDTGSVYLPPRSVGLRRHYFTAYDKRQERLAKGYPDPGPLLRLEASAARQKGATLADAWDAGPLFWDIVSPDIWPAPDGVEPWAPQALGWSAGPYQGATPAARLDRYLEGPAGQELLRLADFPGGLAALRAWVARVEKSGSIGSGSAAAAEERSDGGHSAPPISASEPVSSDMPQVRGRGSDLRQCVGRA